MASIKTGPLVSDLAGAVGGVVFKRGPGGLCVQTKMVPTRKTGAKSSTVRNLMAQVSKAWGALTVDQKDAWENAAGLDVVSNRVGSAHRVTGFGLYVSNILRQAGRETIVWPLTPSPSDLAGPLMAVAESSGGDVYLTGFSRNLAVGENVLVRTYKGVPVGRASSRTRVESYTEVAAGDGLGLVPERGQALDAATGKLNFVGTYYAGTTYTVEMWVKFSSAWPGTEQYIFGWGSPQRRIAVNNGGTQYWDGAANRLIVAGKPAVGVWIQYAFVTDQGAGTFKAYRNGVAIGSPIACTAMGLTSLIVWGTYLNTVGMVGMSVDEMRVSSVARTSAEILANWNGGKGRAVIVDGSTLGAYRCESVVGGQLVDASSGGRNLTIAGASSVLGALCRKIYPAADRPAVGSINVGISCLPSVLSAGVARAQKTTFLWV